MNALKTRDKLYKKMQSVGVTITLEDRSPIKLWDGNLLRAFRTDKVSQLPFRRRQDFLDVPNRNVTEFMVGMPPEMPAGKTAAAGARVPADVTDPTTGSPCETQGDMIVTLLAPGTVIYVGHERLSIERHEGQQLPDKTTGRDIWIYLLLQSDS